MGLLNHLCQLYGFLFVCLFVVVFYCFLFVCSIIVLLLYFLAGLFVFADAVLVVFVFCFVCFYLYISIKKPLLFLIFSFSCNNHC